MTLRELVLEIFGIIDALAWDDEVAEIESLIAEYVEEEIGKVLLEKR